MRTTLPRALRAVVLGLALLTSFALRAQNFPVRASVTILNPSTYLEDYGRANNTLVVLTLVDNRPSYTGRLRFTIEGRGFRAETSPNTDLPPLTLRRGQPLILRGTRLQDYFAVRNLQFNGIDARTFVANGGVLPDGPVTICVEFVDANRPQDPAVSNPACATRFLQRNLPPEITLGNTPQRNWTPVSVVNLGWIPRHLASPANDEYILEMWERRPGLTDDQIMRSTQPLRRPFPVQATRYVWTNYDRLLQSGKEYIWRVQVRDRLNARTFVNDGYSAIASFKILPSVTDPGPGGGVAGAGDGDGSNGGPPPGGGGNGDGDGGGNESTDDPNYCGAPLTVPTYNFNVATSELEFTWVNVPEAHRYQIMVTSPAEQVYVVDPPAGSAAFAVPIVPEEGQFNIRFCKLCPDGTQECLDFPIIIGSTDDNCQSRHTVSLYQLWNDRAYLQYDHPRQNIPPAKIRYRRQLLGNYQDVPLGTLDSVDFPVDTFFNLDYVGETGSLQRGITYEAQLSTQCPEDTTWSAWSQPVPFNYDCRITDSLTVSNVRERTADIGLPQYANALHYEIHFRSFGRPSWVYSPNHTGRSATLRGLSPDENYEVKVRYMCNQNVWSNFSPIDTFTTLKVCYPPDSLRVVDTETYRVTLAWNEGQNGVFTRIRYRTLPWGQNNVGYSAGAWQVADLLRSPATLDNLLPGAGYEFELQTECGPNQSDYVPGGTFYTDCPSPVVDVSNIDKFSAQFDLTHSYVGDPTVEYEYRRLGDTTWTTVVPRPPGGAFGDDGGRGVFASPYVAIAVNLENYTQYEVRARTICRGTNYSEWGPTAYFRTLVHCPTPVNLGVADLGRNNARLIWDSAGTVNDFEVVILELNAMNQQASQAATFLTSAGGASDNDPGGTPVTGSTQTNTPPPPPNYNGRAWRRFRTSRPYIDLNWLTPGLEYRVVVRATCPTVDWTDYSEELRFRTFCEDARVDQGGLDRAYGNTAEVSWQRNPSCASRYRVLIEKGPGHQPFNFFFNGNGQMLLMPPGMGGGNAPYVDSFEVTGLTATFNGLRPNTNYRFRVKAMLEENAFAPVADRTKTSDLVPADGGVVAGTEDWGGYGRWFAFRTDHCSAPLQIEELPLGRSSLELSWMESSGVNNYEVKYRPRDIPNSVWLTENTSDNRIELVNLQSNEVYEYQVTEVCQDGVNRQSAPQDTFKLGRVSRNNGYYVCGVNTSVDVSNQTALPTLRKGDTIQAFDFAVVITKVSGSNGIFSGEGEIVVPFFNKAKMTFEFNGIFINIQKRLVNGYLDATGVGVEILPPWADSLLQTAIDVLDVMDQVAGQMQVATLDSIMQCCGQHLPIELQDQVQAVLDCYAANPVDPVSAGCETLLDSLMTHVTDDIDSIIVSLDTQIVVSTTLDVIRTAVEELEADYAASTIANKQQYTALRTQVSGSYPSLPAGRPGNNNINYLQRSWSIPVTGAPPAVRNQTVDLFGDRALALQAKSLELTEVEMLHSIHAEIARQVALKDFSGALRSGDTDVFTPVHQLVQTAWTDGDRPDNIDLTPMVAEAKRLLLLKVNYLTND